MMPVPEAVRRVLRARRARHVRRALQAPSLVYRFVTSPDLDDKTMGISLCRATWRGGATPLFLAIGRGTMRADRLYCNHIPTREWVRIADTPLYAFARNQVHGDRSKDPYRDYLKRAHGYSHEAVAKRCEEFERLIDRVRDGTAETFVLVHVAGNGMLQIKDGAHRAAAALTVDPAARIECKIVA